MNIILINPYGPIPIPEEKWREYRFTIIGKYLASLGHEVTWYTSSFSHHFKTQRSSGWKDISVGENFKIVLVPTPGYNKNISFGRIVRDAIFSFKVYHREFPVKPDLIIYSESPLSFGYAGYKLGKKLSVPVIYDQMDLWPELIINSFPTKFQKFIKLFFYPVFRNRRIIYSRLSGFISLAKPYMDIPLSIVPSLQKKPHAVIYNGIDVKEFRAGVSPAKELLDILPGKDKQDVWFTFAGTLGPSYDILNLLSVAEKIANQKMNSIKFLIAGDGPLKQEVLDFIGRFGSANVVYLGKLRPESLSYLYSKSDVGLSIYTEVSNVEMPDKFYDYTAAGLPVINSLRGEVGTFVENENVGINYLPGNIDSLYSAIIELYGNPERRKKYASNSFNLGSVFDKNEQIKKLGTLIEQVMKTNSYV